MVKKPYLCGRCGDRFSRASKYCPSCGAILSMPLGSGEPGETTILDKFSRSGWIEVAIFMALLGVFTYIGMRAVFSREADDYVMVEYGTQYRDKLDNTVYKKDIKTKIVPVEVADQYTIKTVYGYNPKRGKTIERETNIKKSAPAVYQTNINVSGDRIVSNPPEVEAVDMQRSALEETTRQMYVYSRRRANGTGNDARGIQIGMTRAQVNAEWGAPNNWESFVSDSGRIERWYYGDPLLDIGYSIRHVDFNENGRVIGVRDMNGFRKLNGY